MTFVTRGVKTNVEQFTVLNTAKKIAQLMIHLYGALVGFGKLKKRKKNDSLKKLKVTKTEFKEKNQ